MIIREAGENYLETIYMLLREQEKVRSIDVCNRLGYSKPTVSVMMKQLRESGYITTDPDGYIALSDTGREIAESIYERHVVIARVLMSIGVSEETAYADACKIEHDISPESFECMKKSYADSLALFEKTGGNTDAFPCRD